MIYVLIYLVGCVTSWAIVRLANSLDKTNKSFNNGEAIILITASWFTVLSVLSGLFAYVIDLNYSTYKKKVKDFLNKEF